MASPVEVAISAARGSHKRLAGVPVILRRKVDGDWVETRIAFATVGETRSEEFIEGSIVVSVRYRDYLIDRGDYAIDGVEVAPLLDDQIVEELDGREVIFRVSPAAGQREYRPSDRARTVWRIHTREVFGNEVEE